MVDERKVIPFTGKYKKQPRFPRPPSDLKTTAAASMSVVVMLMMGFNFSMFQAKNFGEDQLNSAVQRGIASVPRVYEPQWKKNLSELETTKVTEMAKKPDAKDSLSFGFLEGKYFLRVNDGKITDIDFTVDEKSAPKLVDNRAEFIKNNASVFVDGFVSVQKTKIEKINSGIKETYQVALQNGASTFEFRLDEQGRMLSLQVK